MDDKSIALADPESRRRMGRPVMLSEITLDDRLQTRVAINDDTVADYAELLKSRHHLPDVWVFEDLETGVLLLADGFHRYHAHAKAGKETIKCDVFPGDFSDALKHALTANAKHGLRRTNADKWRAVELALDEFGDQSNPELARMCGVTAPFVNNVRKCGEPKTVSGSPSKRTIGGDGKSRPANEAARQAQREQIREAVAENPEATHRAIARKTGADRKTVAAVRKKSKPDTNETGGNVNLPLRSGRDGCPDDELTAKKVSKARDHLVAAAKLLGEVADDSRITPMLRNAIDESLQLCDKVRGSLASSSPEADTNRCPG